MNDILKSVANLFFRFDPNIIWTPLLLVLLSSYNSDAQRTPCGTLPPSQQELITVETALSSIPSVSSVSWEIPVRVTVFQKNDGTGWPFSVDNAYIDDFLDNMNSKLAGGANAFHFFRCGPINYINATQLYEGALEVEDYSYVRNFLNLYLYYEPNVNPHAPFPWFNQPNVVYLTSGTGDIYQGNGFHELGHTLGLYHVFSPK